MNNGKKIQSNDLSDSTTACGAKGLTTKNRASLISKTSRNNPTNTKVLGTSNRTTIDPIKMGISSLPRRTTISTRRISGTYHTTQRLKKTPTTLAKRMTIDAKSFNQKRDATDSSKTLFAKPKKTTDKLACPVPSCDMTFFYKTSLAAHVKSHAPQNNCEHCGRTFGIPTALSKHLRENCTKISVAGRKKLLESDAKLEKQKTPVRSPRLNRARDELLDLVFTSELDRLKAVPFKDFVPIKGIGRTPRKLIKCYDCGEKFKNPLQFATHAEHCDAPKVDLKMNAI
ncbi:uncharacterized protein LOC119070642 [Bradysia coprophila]|uniref:uncharacterized protein LOC119070642 n=1 Tax=Bradysia coprophila TaxID=38358 RepID=UPI00187DA346|nr:uncharacterized protein LOC119070642 [Bradysia coprophila]